MIRQMQFGLKMMKMVPIEVKKKEKSKEQRGWSEKMMACFCMTACLAIVDTTPFRWEQSFLHSKTGRYQGREDKDERNWCKGTRGKM
jgi:hypothetical protein